MSTSFKEMAPSNLLGRPASRAGFCWSPTLAAADQTPEAPHRWDALAEASSSSLPGCAEHLDRSCFAVRAQHDGGWIQLHRHGHQYRRQGWGSELKAAPPLARRGHRHPQPIRYAPHPQPTDDAECQSLADHLDLV
jgi:hypothetical protein